MGKTNFRTWYYFTPDEIDRIIESLLGIYGVTALTLKKKNSEG